MQYSENMRRKHLFDELDCIWLFIWIFNAETNFYDRQGVVSARAATILRNTETYPSPNNLFNKVFIRMRICYTTVITFTIT